MKHEHSFLRYVTVYTIKQNFHMMMRGGLSLQKKVMDIILILLGSLIFAIGVNVFIIPTDLGEGGVTGVTIILYYLYKWSPGLVNFIINGILLIVGYRFLNKHTIGYTIIAVVTNALFLHLTRNWSIDSNEIIVNTIFAGLLGGLGVGLIIRVGGTIAGTSILASITKKYLGWNVSYGLLFFDLIVVFSSYFVIGIERLLLTIIMLYISTKTMQFVIEGLNMRKAITIISSNPDEIAQKVNNQMRRGVTVYSGHGYYSQENVNILYIVIGSQEVMRLKRIVQAADDNAFVAIHDVRDVFGEGFVALDT